MPNLHAKCYLNENEAIITSMNLYEFSQVNNNEMGIHIIKTKDPELYNSVFEEVQRLLTASEEIRVTIQKLAATTKETNKSTGFCITTGVKIPFNLKMPLSSDAFKSWNKFGDKTYSEKFCHFSGEHSNGETSFEKPILKKNWKKAQETFGI